jgi:hypothetical protein
MPDSLNPTERRNFDIWRELAIPTYPNLSETSLWELRTTASTRWFMSEDIEAESTDQLVKLFDQYLLVKTLTD